MIEESGNVTYYMYVYAGFGSRTTSSEGIKISVSLISLDDIYRTQHDGYEGNVVDVPLLLARHVLDSNT